MNSKRIRVITCIKETSFKIYVLGGGAARVQRRLVYMYLLNVPSVSSHYFNKIKRTCLLGKEPALSLEILNWQLNILSSSLKAMFCSIVLIRRITMTITSRFFKHLSLQK